MFNSLEATPLFHPTAGTLYSYEWKEQSRKKVMHNGNLVNIDVMPIIKCLLSRLKFSYKFDTLILSQALNVSLLTF